MAKNRTAKGAEPRQSLDELFLKDFSGLTGKPAMILHFPAALTEFQETSVWKTLQLLDGSPDELDVIIESPGGSADAAYKIMKMIRSCVKTVRVFIPRRAKSAATLLSIGADEIVVHTIGELGPLDVQVPEHTEHDSLSFMSALNHHRAIEEVERYSLLALDQAVQLILDRSGMRMQDAVNSAIQFSCGIMEPIANQIDPLKLGARARSNEVGMEYGTRLLRMRNDAPNEEFAREIVEKLCKSYPSHSFVIDAEELLRLGLNARNMTTNEDAALKVYMSFIDNHRMSRDIQGVYLYPKSGGASTNEAKPDAASTPSRSSKGRKSDSTVQEDA